MTVQQLIDQLQKLDPQLPVVIYDREYGVYDPIRTPRLVENVYLPTDANVSEVAPLAVQMTTSTVW